MTTVDERLRACGLKVTATRRAVLLAVEEHPHSGVEAVLARVRASLPETSAQAVYGVLSAFTDAGIVRRIEPEGHPRRFELRVGDNHHHAVCRRCGAVADVDCVAGEAPCLHPQTASGFAIDTADVTFWGTCPGCLPRPTDRHPLHPSGGRTRPSPTGGT